MAMILKQELPELETPLDYPACLDRIMKAAEYRANYEIAISKFERLYLEWMKTEQLDPVSFISNLLKEKL